MRFTLGYYSVRIVDHDDQSIPLKDFSSTHDLYSVFIEYLKQRDDSHFKDAEQYKVFRVTEYMTEEKLVKGIIEIGDYGMSAELIDIESADKTYEKSTTEAEMIPHYFLAYLPPNVNQGIIILQKNSGRGVQTALFRDFERQIKDYNPKGKVNFYPMLPRDFIDELTKKGRFTKIRFIRYNQLVDVTDAYRQERLGKAKSVEGTTEFTYQPERNRNFSEMLRNLTIEAIKDSSKMGNMAEAIGYECDNVKVEVELGGRKKTINLNRLESLKADIDITETIQTNKDGHPEFFSIDAIAIDFLESILTDLGAENDEQN